MSVEQREGHRLFHDRLDRSRLEADRHATPFLPDGDCSLEALLQMRRRMAAGWEPEPFDDDEKETLNQVRDENL